MEIFDADKIVQMHFLNYLGYESKKGSFKIYLGKENIDTLYKSKMEKTLK